jgi:3-deoxy-D-manno-octulosonic-acid transferase
VSETPMSFGDRSVAIAYASLAGLAHATAAASRIVPGLSERIREQMAERVGRYGASPSLEPAAMVVWAHAASVGEVRAVEPLLAALRASRPGLRVVVTCQTANGRALARAIGADEARFAPLDSAIAVRRAIAHFRPNLFLLVETEIWPRLLAELARTGVPAAMVSARVSARSYERYRVAKRLFASPLATLALVCARDEDSAARLVSLGTRAAVTSVCGDLKLDAIDEGIVQATPPALGSSSDGPRYVIAISTHEGEEEVVVDAFVRVRVTRPNLRLVLAPRHPERRDAVRSLVGRSLRTKLWSSSVGDVGTDWDVLIVDTTGELRGFIRSATCGFVGGSLVPVGGHNLAEPAAFRLPVAVGPGLDNVTHHAELLRSHAALTIVHDANELALQWERWLDEPLAAKRTGDAAHEAFRASGGALGRVLAGIEPLLHQRGGAPHRGTA